MEEIWETMEDFFCENQCFCEQIVCCDVEIVELCESEHEVKEILFIVCCV